MPRNSEQYPYPSYPENYYDYQMQHAQQQQQQQQQHGQQQQQYQQPHYQQHVPPGYSHAHAAYYHQVQQDYSNQAGPSYGSSQLYQAGTVDDDNQEESPSPSAPYEEHSPNYPSFGQFQLDPGTYGENSNIEHFITEHELPAAEVVTYFPASNRTDIHTDKGVIWRCQMCNVNIPARNKVEHIFRHKNQPRYTCSCKAKFARGQDKNRHLKEQALCTECQTTKVGRRGQNGKCQMCL